MSIEKKKHLDFQRAYFDRNAEYFKSAVPEEIVSRSREITGTIITGGKIRLLDVGTGTGAFLGLYHERGVPYSNMHACDLSAEMLTEAERRFPEVSFWHGDVREFPQERGPFDLIVFNACFGNIFDQAAVLKKCRSLLNEMGKIAISHPMGNTFVKQLKDAEPDLVMSLLPGRENLEGYCRDLQMTLPVFRDEAQLYLALMQLSAEKR